MVSAFRGIPYTSTGSARVQGWLGSPRARLRGTRERATSGPLTLIDALEMNARTGARPWLAHTQEDDARMLIARGDPADAERAERLREEAFST